DGRVVGFGFAAALPLLYRLDAPITRLAALKPLYWSGQMCYSLYLVHQLPVKVVSHLLFNWGFQSAWSTLLITVPACVLVACAFGWIFHVAVERKFLNRPVAAAAPEAVKPHAGLAPALISSS